MNPEGVKYLSIKKAGRKTSFLVENIGFEPMTSSMPWKRSSQLS